MASAGVLSASEGEPEESDLFDEQNLQEAFGERVLQVELHPHRAEPDLVSFLPKLERFLSRKLREHIAARRAGLKIWVALRVQYCRADDPEARFEAHLHTTNKVLFTAADIDETNAAIANELIDRNANFVRNKSGLVLVSILLAVLKIAIFSPLAGRGFQELPRFLAHKKAIVNVRNTDNACFGYAVAAALHGTGLNHVTRPQAYIRFFEQDGLNRLVYPIQPESLPDVERTLELNINVFSFFDDDGRARYPLYVSKNPFPNRPEIDLLYWNAHYAWIKNFDKFLFDLHAHEHTHIWCKRCFGYFQSQRALDIHTSVCSRGNFSSCIYTLAAPGTKLKFINERYQQRAAAVIYADFEALTAPTCANQISDANLRHMSRYQKHVPCAVGLKVVSELATLANLPYEQHTGEDVVEWFLTRLLQLEAMFRHDIFDVRRLIMTDEDVAAFARATDCHICRTPFINAQQKVRDHDHISGKFRGAAHQHCNLKLQTTYKLPVFFHNLRNYDGHIISLSLNRFPDVKIGLIGQGMEKYLVISWGPHIVFKDSYQFLSASLEQLGSNLLKKGRENFHFVLDEFAATCTQDQISLLLRKGVFPYDFCNSWERLNDAALPAIEQFSSELRQTTCSADDYAHACTVWAQFAMRRFQDYLDLYLKTGSY